MKITTKIILVIIIVSCLGFFAFWNLIDTGILEITVNDYGRREDGLFYVNATVTNGLREEIWGKFYVQVYNPHANQWYSRYFPEELFNMQYNTSITIPSGDSFTKNVSFGVPKNETVIAVRFSRYDNYNTFNIQQIECITEIHQ